MIKFIVMLAIITTLLGCKEISRLNINGDANSPTFHVLNGSIPIESITVDHFCLDNEKLSSEQKWMVSNINPSENYFSSITYGQPPKQFTEQYRATKLVENELYYVQIRALQTDADGLFWIENTNGMKKIVNVIIEENLTFEDWIKNQHDSLMIKCK